MTHKPIEPEHVPDGRREVDIVWRGRIERELKDAVARLTAIEGGLAVNTTATLANGGKLDAHIQRTESFITKMAPAGTAVDYYTSGVRVIGMIGEAFQWCAKWVARFLKFVAPVAAAFAAVYATWPAESRAIFEWLKFWKH